MSSSESTSCKATFEQAFKKLNAIVEKMESGDMPLEKLVESYEQGSELLLHCKEKLSEAKMRVEQVDAKHSS